MNWAGKLVLFWCGLHLSFFIAPLVWYSDAAMGLAAMSFILTVLPVTGLLFLVEFNYD